MSVKKVEKSIKEEIVQAIHESKECKCHNHGHSVSCGVYGLGLVGAAFYYFQHMPANDQLIATIFKIIFWPAFLVYRLLERNIF